MSSLCHQNGYGLVKYNTPRNLYHDLTKQIKIALLAEFIVFSIRGVNNRTLKIHLMILIYERKKLPIKQERSIY